jgi:hypothetical protein
VVVVVVLVAVGGAVAVVGAVGVAFAFWKDGVGFRRGSITGKESEMEINELQNVARDLSRRGIAGGWYWQHGESVFIRTVTYHWVGTIIEVGADYVVLSPACWVADSGRWAEALAHGFSSSAELEPPAKSKKAAHIPQQVAVVQRAAIVDSVLWEHPIPERAQ